VSFQRYVALGDSTTEGLEDLNPDGTHRGWADRLAELIAAESPGLLYANLAIRGRKLPQIRAEQLEPALAMEPDLASVLGGLNDILRREVDLAARAEDLEAMVAALRGAGATVIVMTFPDPTVVITVAAARIRARVEAFNVAIRELAERQGAVLVDMELKSEQHPSFWSADRLHANSRGHEWIAAMAATELGIPVPDGDWNADLPPHRPSPRPVRVASDVAWMGRHLAPWVLRRVRGRSSGDGIEPKRPELTPVLPR
jgi:lysophospholipase L1-like esterase